MQTFTEKNAIAVEGITVEKSVEALKRACNVIIADDGRIIDICEKPSSPSSTYRGVGTYIFDPIVFEYIKKTPVGPPRGEKEITNTIKLMTETKKVYSTMIRGREININTLDDLVAATNLLLLEKKKQ